jgi:hypothetical protein
MEVGLKKAVEKLMMQNRRTHGEYQHTVPSPTSYPYQWFWDSCFHAIILSHIDVQDAKSELRSLVSHQYEDGMIAHIRYWERFDILKYDWGPQRTSSLIQPPLIAQAVWRVFESEPDLDFLHEMYPRLVWYYDFVRTTRDLRGVGLVGIVNPDESGEDNSPRFDGLLNLPPKHSVEEHSRKRFVLSDKHRECQMDVRCTSESFWMEDVPFNSFLVYNLRILAEIAEALSMPEAAETHRAHAEHTATAMRTHMMEEGVFWSLARKDAMPIRTRSWSRFAPLLAKLYTDEEAELLIKEHLLDQESFWLPCGVPTVPESEPAYDPLEPGWGDAWQHPHWRGPIWINVHWIISQGLTIYGYHDLALELKEKSIRLIEANGFREYFHPDTGVGMGAQDFTWGGLILDM